MNKDNKAIFESFATSRQQIVSEKGGFGSNVLKSAVAPGAQLMSRVNAAGTPPEEEIMPARPNPAVDNADPSTLTHSEPARPNPAVDNADPGTLTEPYGLDQFRQMEQEGTLADHINSMTDEDAARYMDEIKQEYDQRAEAEGLPPSDDPGSDFARGEEMARNLKPEYDNAKESIATRADVDPEAVGQELDFKDNEVAPAVRPDTDKDNWATRIGAEEIPPVPTGADTPNGGQPAEAPPAADMSDVDVPGVTNTQNPTAPIGDFDWNKAHTGMDTDNSGYLNDVEAGPKGSFLNRFSAAARMPEAEDDGSLPYLTPDGQKLTNSFNNLDPEELPVSAQPLPEDPTISNTVDAGGDPTDPASRDYTNNKDYAGSNEAPRQIAPEVPQTSDVLGQNASSAAPDNPFPKAAAAANITGNPAPRTITPPAATPTDPPRSTGTDAFSWIKGGPAPSSQFDDASKGKGINTRFGEGPVNPYPDSPMSKPMLNPYDSSRIGLNQPAPPADPNPYADDPYGVKAAGTPEDFAANETEEPELEDPTRPSSEELEQMERETGTGRFSKEGRRAHRKAQNKEYRQNKKQYKQDTRDALYQSTYAAQQKELADDREAFKGMSLDDLYKKRDDLQKIQRAEREKRRAGREERQARNAGRNKPATDANGDIEGVDYQEPAARSAAEAEAQIQSGGRARELDRSRKLQAQKAAQTKPNRPQSTPTPPATAQKPGIGRKLMSFLPGGEKPSEVFGKHAGREGANAAVRGTNHQKSFKDHNAEMNAQRQAKADEQAAKKQAVKSQAGTLGKTTTPPTSRTTDKKPPTVGQSSSATPADTQKKKGGFLSGFKVAKTPSTSRPGQGRFGRGVKR